MRGQGSQPGGQPSQEIKLDKTAPTTTIGSGPPTATSSRTADIAFAGADTRSGVARVECRLDGGVWETSRACSGT